MLKLVASLMRGDVHDRSSAAAALGIQKAAAAHLIDAMVDLPGMILFTSNGLKAVRFDPGTLQPSQEAIARTTTPPSQAAVIATCFASSLGPLFRGSIYEGALADTLNRLRAEARDAHHVSEVERKFYFVRGGGEPSLRKKSGVLDELVEAVLRSQWATMTYAHLGKPSERLRIQPLSIVIYHHQIYVVGRNDAHGAYPYRLSRIKKAEREVESFEYPPKESYNPDKVFGECFGIFISKDHPVTRVSLRLSGPFAHYAKAHSWHPTQKVEQDGEDVLVYFRLRVCPELVGWILSMSPHVEVVEPEDLRDKVVNAATAALARYDLAVTQPRLPGSPP